MANTSFEQIVEKTFDSFKKITPALIGVILACGMILFLPISILKTIGLYTLHPNIRTCIGIIFILSTAILLAIIITTIYKKVAKEISCVFMRRTQHKKIKHLSDQQRKILKKILDSTKKSQELDCTSGDVNYLLSNKFIYEPMQTVTIGAAIQNHRKFAPHPWLIEYYREKPYCLDIKNI